MVSVCYHDACDMVLLISSFRSRACTTVIYFGEAARRVHQKNCHVALTALDVTFVVDCAVLQEM
jgi:hypothetical protein